MTDCQPLQTKCLFSLSSSLMTNNLPAFPLILRYDLPSFQGNNRSLHPTLTNYPQAKSPTFRKTALLGLDAVLDDKCLSAEDAEALTSFLTVGATMFGVILMGWGPSSRRLPFLQCSRSVATESSNDNLPARAICVINDRALRPNLKRRNTSTRAIKLLATAIAVANRSVSPRNS